MALISYQFKTRIYVLNCQMHLKENQRLKKVSQKNNFENKLLENVGVELIENLNTNEICEELKTKDFARYSSVIFFMDFACSCDVNSMLNNICEHGAVNDSLRLIPKIVFTFKFFDDILFEEMFGSSRDHLTITCRKNKETTIFEIVDENLDYVFERLFKFFYEKTAKPDFENLYLLQDLESPTVNNFLLLQFKQIGIQPKKRNYIKLFEELVEFANGHPLQNLINGITEICEYEKECIHIETNQRFHDYYSQTLNPALAIAINHRTFNKELTRIGSEKDIYALTKVCGEKRIPIVVLPDGTAEDVQELMERVQNTDLSLLRSLFIFVMSHGGEGDIIHTKTSTYTVNECIKKPLLQNPTLRDVKKFVLINACRGSFNPNLDDNDQPLKSTDIKDLNENTLVMYSARKGCVSLRTTEGSICIQKFCELFEKCEQKHSLQKLHQDIEQDLLSEWSTFDSVTEYCFNPYADHVVRKRYFDSTNFRPIKEAFKVFNKGEFFGHQKWQSDQSSKK